jgi:hypothetical protein
LTHTTWKLPQLSPTFTYAYIPEQNPLSHQVEEHFGACLGSVAAIHAALSAHAAPRTLAVEVDLGEPVDWEHARLFDEAAWERQGGGFDRPLGQGPPQHAAASAVARPDPRSPAAADAERAAALFRRLRRRLARTRRYNRAGRFREAREQAAAVLAAAAAAGCGLVAEWAARMLGRAGYATSATLDDLELRIDTAEALWGAGGGFA